MNIDSKHKKIRVKRKRSLLKKGELRYCLIIAAICLVLGFGLAFITCNVPSFVDRIIQKQTDRIVAEKMKDFEKGMAGKTGKENIADLVKKYKDKAMGY